MASSNTFELDQFKKGYFLVWSVCTQTAGSPHTILKVDKKEMFDVAPKPNTPSLQFLTKGSYTMESNTTPQLIVKLNGGDLKSSISAGVISDSEARAVGYAYSICIEDYTDDDYNDIYINIIGWRTKG